MTEVEIEELERKVTGSASVVVEEPRSAEAFRDKKREEDMRFFLLELGSEEQSDSLDKEEVAIVMEIARVR